MSPEKQEIRVLLIDDEDAFRRPLARRLTRRGLTVFDAGGGVPGLEWLADHIAHVVVLDVKMPGMDGLETLRRLKESHPKIEVILLTGQASAQDGVAGIMSGAFDYLTKPVEIEHLAGKIRQAYERMMWQEDQARIADYRANVEQRMSAAERLASLGTMSAGIAHEINNPLAIIYESAGWLRRRMEKDDRLPDDLRESMSLALGKIEAGVNRARTITHQLLGFARKSDWTHECFDLIELIGEVQDLTRRAAENARVTVTGSPADGPFLLVSDPNQVRQVLINLVTNAVQATPPGGTVRLSANSQDAWARVRVEDDGPGIPREHLDRIFEPFFSTKPPGQGTGLGLSVSKSIMEKLGGKLEVESRVGAGAAFTLFLPLRENGQNEI